MVFPFLSFHSFLMQMMGSLGLWAIFDSFFMFVWTMSYATIWIWGIVSKNKSFICIFLVAKMWICRFYCFFLVIFILLYVYPFLNQRLSFLMTLVENSWLYFCFLVLPGWRMWGKETLKMKSHFYLRNKTFSCT